MIRSLKLFADCVESLRTAEKAYEEDPTAARRRIVTDLQNKVDAWIKWVRSQQDSELARKVPPFIGKTPLSGYKGVMNDDVMKHLIETHTPEEIERFTKMMQGV